MTAVGFAAIAAVAPRLGVVPPLLLLPACAIAASAIDLDGFEPPGPILYPLALTMGWLFALALTGSGATRLAWSAAGAAAGIGVWAVATRDRLGSRAPERKRSFMGAALPAAFGWCAGWLWAPGALVLGAVVALTAVGFAAVRTSGDEHVTAGARSKVPLWAICAAGYLSVVVCAAVGSA